MTATHEVEVDSVPIIGLDPYIKKMYAEGWRLAGITEDHSLYTVVWERPIARTRFIGVTLDAHSSIHEGEPE